LVYTAHPFSVNVAWMFTYLDLEYSLELGVTSSQAKASGACTFRQGKGELLHGAIKSAPGRRIAF